MFGGSRKPYSAITVQVDRLTSEAYEEDDVGGIIDLVEVVRIQESGPTEAARALRKKLKYGSPHRQIRALVILDGLIQNAGARFQRAFADEPLLERLRLMAREETVDPQVRQKCKVLFIQWANAYKGTPGLERIASLYKELPKTQRPAAARQKVLQDSEQPESDSEPSHAPSPAVRSRATSSAQTATASTVPSRPVTLTPTSSNFSSKLSRTKNKFSGKSFNLAKEKEGMTNCIARSSIASTNLLNGLQLINRETERVSQNPEVVSRFETCKSLRRQILLYIQHVESDDWIGSLVNANDELVKALTAYEIMDRSIDDDSDSDAWERTPAAASKHMRHVSADTEAQLAGLSLAESAPVKPPRPAPGGLTMPPKPSFPSASAPEEEDDADDTEAPDKISLHQALVSSDSELDFEDRMVSWQADAARDLGRHEGLHCGLNASSALYRHHAESSPALINYGEGEQTSAPAEAGSQPQPLTRANLRAAMQQRQRDRSGSHKRQRRFTPGRALTKSREFVLTPITVSVKGVLRFQRWWEDVFWGAVEEKVRKQKQKKKGKEMDDQGLNEADRQRTGAGIDQSPLMQPNENSQPFQRHSDSEESDEDKSHGPEALKLDGVNELRPLDLPQLDLAFPSFAEQADAIDDNEHVHSEERLGRAGVR